MKILAIVKFNNGEAFVLDEKPKLLYEKRGNLLIGTDKTKTIYRYLYYEKPSKNWKAFGGAEFDLPLKNGQIEYCYGQWWEGGSYEASKLLGIDIANCTLESIDELKKCYVFCGYLCDYKKMSKARKNYNGKIYEYYEYKKELKK